MKLNNREFSRAGWISATLRRLESRVEMKKEKKEKKIKIKTKKKKTKKVDIKFFLSLNRMDVNFILYI